MAGKTANNNKNTKQVVGGWNVYLNKNGQTVMYDPLSKNGYVILPDNVNNFTLYHNRIALAIALGMVLVSFMNDWKLPLLAAVVFIAMLEFRYRKAWLPSLVCVPNFKPENKRGFVDSLVETKNVTRYILLFFAYLAFGILLVINGYQMQASALIIGANYVILAGCIYLAVCYLIAVIRIKR